MAQDKNPDMNAQSRELRFIIVSLLYIAFQTIDRYIAIKTFDQSAVSIININLRQHFVLKQSVDRLGTVYTQNELGVIINMVVFSEIGQVGPHNFRGHHYQTGIIEQRDVFFQ
jgi:hypothetical protein